MILDEAQNIKNSSSVRWKTLLGFHCRNRLLLTGTPIQNSMQGELTIMAKWPKCADELYRAVGVAAFHHAEFVWLAWRVQWMVLKRHRERSGEQRQQVERAPTQTTTYDPEAIHAASCQEARTEWAQWEGMHFYFGTNFADVQGFLDRNRHIRGLEPKAACTLLRTFGQRIGGRPTRESCQYRWCRLSTLAHEFGHAIPQGQFFYCLEFAGERSFMMFVGLQSPWAIWTSRRWVTIRFCALCAVWTHHTGRRLSAIAIFNTKSHRIFYSFTSISGRRSSGCPLGVITFFCKRQLHKQTFQHLVDRLDPQVSPGYR